jgi:signal transduction histidine kinase
MRPDHLKIALNSWVLKVLTKPPVSRSARVGAIVGLVAGIGLADYLSGIWISLQVFYLIPISFAVAWLGFFAAFVTSIVCIVVRVGGDYVQNAPYAHHPSITWNSLVFLATYMTVAWGINLLVNFQRELAERVRARTQALKRETEARQKLQQELIETSERERRTIGNDLHDGLGQHLTAMAYAAQILSQQLGNHPAASGARDLVRLAEEGIQQSRQLARGLLLTAIEPENLTREMSELAASVQRQTGVACHFEARAVPTVKDSNTASNLFRIAEEAARNSTRHARPTALHMSLSHERDCLVLDIRDDGGGLPEESDRKVGVGLSVMDQRAKLLGGELIVESAQGKGTHIRCRVPLNQAVGVAI